jgi:hypothetical protein
MSYEKTIWVDHIVDPETGEVIQQGTRFTEARANKMEQGIFDNDARSIGNKEKLDNSFYADLGAYYGNTKLIDDFQDIGGRSVGSEDTINIKIGSKSLKVEEVNNISGSIISDFNNLPTFNLGTFNNGSPSSIDDYLVLVVYVSDASMVANIGFGLSPESIYNVSNNTNKTISAGILTGWNYFKIRKNEVIGTADINSDMKSTRMFWTSISNAQGAYVSFQLLQLVKKDPLDNYPNPFQHNGMRDFIINSGEWYLGKEFGKIVLRELTVESDDINDINALEGVNIYRDFISHAEFEVYTGGRTTRICWYEDDQNYFIAHLYDNAARLYVLENGINTENHVDPLEFVKGDLIRFILHKKNNDITLHIYKNGALVSQIKGQTSLLNLKLAIYTLQYRTDTLKSLSISEISHVHHANVAEVAKSLAKQPYCELKLSSAQSIQSGSTAKNIAWDTVVSDDFDMFDINDPDAIIINESGDYEMYCTVMFDSNATGIRSASISIEGVEGVSFDRRNAVNGSNTLITIPANKYLTKGQKIVVQVYQTSGVALDITAGISRIVVRKVG